MENQKRRIADQQLNRFVGKGINAHQTTQLAPSSLLQPFSKQLIEKLEERHRKIEQTLIETIGNPFYSELGFIIYCGDCMPILNCLLETNFNVDLTITSPPYNIGKEYEEPLTIEAYITWCEKWMNQIFKLTKDTGSFWLNSGYLQIPERGLCIPIPYLIWDKSPFYLLQEIVWKYGAGVSAKKRLSPRNEKWLFYVKNHRDYTFNLDAIRDPNVKYPNQKKHGKYRCNPLGKNPSDVWEFPKVTTGKNRSSKERTEHPAQFPLALVERIIQASSNPLELILDPFSGSGSSGIAAAGLGRLFLGIEINPYYCNIAVERFEKFKKEREKTF